MKELNLTSIDNSEIKYKINNYPDGQRDINILPTFWITANFTITAITIKSRLNNMEDLNLIICATQALRNLGLKEIHLYVPYIMGLRSDRLFAKGGVRYIKDILAPIINSQNYESVTCIDAHSFVAENCINNLQVLDNVHLVKFALSDLNIKKKFVLVSPDDGASKKIYKVAEAIDYKGEIIICSKSRNADGTLFKTNVPLNDRESKSFIIVDDICDGGNTFINIARIIRRAYDGLEDISNIKIYLIVTHGIFSQGTTELGQYFDHIYTTNSYQDCNALDRLKVNQLKVF